MTTSTCQDSSESPDGTSSDDPFQHNDDLQEEIKSLEKLAKDPQVVAKLASVTSRSDVLKLPKKLRLVWFIFLMVEHRRFRVAMRQVGELLVAPDTKIIALIGMTGIGKSTLINKGLLEVIKKYVGPVSAQCLPIVVVNVASHGSEKRFSWSAFYRQILSKGKEILIERKRGVSRDGSGKGALLSTPRNRQTLPDLLDFIERMFRNRDVQLLVVDEAVHLLRFGEPRATMEAIKSMGDLHGPAKLLLMGSFDLLSLVTSLDQVVRRGEIIHFGRYHVARSDRDKLSDDEVEFRKVLLKFQQLWPFEVVPNLVRNWRKLGKASAGSVGLLKTLLVRLAILQSKAKDGFITAEMWAKASKSVGALKLIEEVTTAGEAAIAEWEYGRGAFTKEELEELIAA